MILYYTGTGNSEFVARALADLLDDESVNLLPYIREKKDGNFRSEKPFVIVFPVYLSTIPVVVKDFLLRSVFEGNKHFYFFATCASSAGASPNEAIDILKKDPEKLFMGCVKVVMPQNYIMLFKMTEPEEQQRRYEQAGNDLKEWAELIRAGKPLETQKTSGLEYAMTKTVAVLYNKMGTGTGKFRTNDSCVGCGLCEKMCPMNNIKMENGKPRWIGKCIHCMACINRCPKQAVEAGKTVGKTRYICPEYKPK